MGAIEGGVGGTGGYQGGTRVDLLLLKLDSLAGANASHQPPLSVSFPASNLATSSNNS